MGGGADGKVIRERLRISLPYVETFNSKGIKGFVHELRSRYVFFVFRDSYVLCIYVMNILCTFHISLSWVWYNVSLSENLLIFLFFYFLVVCIFEMKLVDFYRLVFSYYCLHHNVSANMSSGLLHVFIELRSLERTSNHVLYLIHGGRSFWFR